MIGRRKKPAPVQRSPHINRAKQSTFHYSSNRSQSERIYDRGEGQPDGAPAPKKRLDPLKRLPVIAATGVLLLSAGYFSLILSNPKVIIASGQPLRDNAPYAAAASDIAAGSILNRSKLTVNREKLASELQQRYPELAEIDISTPFFRPGMTIKLTMAKPAAVLDTDNGDFLLDNRGVALFDTNDVRLGIKEGPLLQIDDQSDAPIQVGKPALTSVQMAFANEIKHQSDAKKLRIENINLIAGGGELAVKYEGSAYIVKYNTNEDARKSFGTYFATREYLEAKRMIPAEYIDVRIPERAYTK